MNIDDQIRTEHLLMEDRVCRSCGMSKGLLADFYRCRKNPSLPSSYSYECKQCAITRVKKRTKQKYRLGTCEVCGSFNTKLVNDICRNCNRYLKSVGYSIDTLEKAVLYLKKK